MHSICGNPKNFWPKTICNFHRIKVILRSVFIQNSHQLYPANFVFNSEDKRQFYIQKHRSSRIAEVIKSSQSQIKRASTSTKNRTEIILLANAGNNAKVQQTHHPLHNIQYLIGSSIFETPVELIHFSVWNAHSFFFFLISIHKMHNSFGTKKSWVNGYYSTATKSYITIELLLLLSVIIDCGHCHFQRYSPRRYQSSILFFRTK